ncbi:MAG: 4Fe-4S binding protein [Promethearchaeota archaeon]
MGKTKITFDYSKCGPNGGIDPRECSQCLKVCDPAILLRHQDLKLEKKEQNPLDPQFWKITAVWLSLCTRCMKCVETCPENAITVSW